MVTYTSLVFSDALLKYINPATANHRFLQCKGHKLKYCSAISFDVFMHLPCSIYNNSSCCCVHKKTHEQNTLVMVHC